MGFVDVVLFELPAANVSNTIDICCQNLETFSISLKIKRFVLINYEGVWCFTIMVISDLI